MKLPRILSGSLYAALVLTACQGAPPTTPGSGSASKVNTRAKTDRIPTLDSLSPKVDLSQTTATNPATASVVSTNPAAPIGTIRGVVLGLDDQKPLAGVLVTLIANNGGSVIANNGGGVIANNGVAYRLQQATATEIRTDALGRFAFTPPDDKPVSLEAKQSDDVKAIALDAKAGGDDVTLQLNFTGEITGTVKAPAGTNVTNMEGIDVYVPGTSYTAKTSKDGAFKLANVPVGTFMVVANRDNLGRGERAGITVVPKKSVDASLTLDTNAPALNSLNPPEAKAGETVTIKGVRFGKTRGATQALTVNGVAITNMTVVDDETITFVVPNNVSTGDVDVKVNGLSGNKLALGVWQKYPNFPRTVTIAGNENGAYADGIGTNAKFNRPFGVALSKDETGVFVADSDNGAIRYVVRATGQTTTIAKATDGGAWNTPVDVALAPNGNLYFVDASKHAVFMVSLTGALPNAIGSVSLVAGASGEANYADGSGAAAKFNTPTGIAFGPDGNMYVADSGNRRIRKVTTTGSVNTFAGSGNLTFNDGMGTGASFGNPLTLAFRPNGDMLVVESSFVWGKNKWEELPGEGEVLPGEELPEGGENELPEGGEEDQLRDAPLSLIRLITPAGAVSTLISDKGGLSSDNRAVGDSGVYDPLGVAVGKDGIVYFADNDTVARFRAIGTDNMVTHLVGQADELGNGVHDDGGESAQAVFMRVGYAAVDSRGNLVVTDPDSGRVCNVNIWHK